jgi:hypothetical protein
MALTAGALNVMLDAFGNAAAFVSLHTDNPGSNGANEVSNGEYARLDPNWGVADNGTLTNADPIVFDVPGSTTIKFLGYWSLADGGTFYGSRALDADQTYATAGTYTIAAGNLSESLT